MTREEIIDKRWKKTNLASWYLQLAPFIRFVGITGSMAFKTANENSDIDVFIIAKNRRIWTCFYFIRLLLRLLGLLRKNHRARAGKICPNRFVTDKYLIVNPQNEYLAKQYNQMVPIFDENDHYCRFLMANKWIEDYGFKKPVCAINLVQGIRLDQIRRLLEMILLSKLGDWLEKIIKQREMRRIAQEEPTMNRENSTVVVNDNEIRIHPYHSK